MRLNLHIGYPKTATTSLQQKIFSEYSGIQYLGKGESLKQSLKQYWTGEPLNEPLESFLESLLQAEHDSVLVSNEFLMSWPSPMSKEGSRWITRDDATTQLSRSGTHPLNDFLALLKRRLPTNIELRVIVSLRRQCDLLGSLAAQHRVTNVNNLVDRVLETNDACFAYAGIVKDLRATVGKENLAVLLYEDGLEVNSRKIAEFIGAEIDEGLFDAPPRLNVKNIRAGQWQTVPVEPKIITIAVKKLKETALGESLLYRAKQILPFLTKLVPKSSHQVMITPDEKQRIQSHFERDNNQLSGLIQRDLRELGYVL